MQGKHVPARAVSQTPRKQFVELPMAGHMEMKLQINTTSGFCCGVLIASPTWTIEVLQIEVQRLSGMRAHEIRMLCGTSELKAKSAILGEFLPEGDSADITIIFRDPLQAEWLAALASDHKDYSAFLGAPPGIRKDSEVAHAAGHAAGRRHESLFAKGQIPHELLGSSHFMLGAIAAAFPTYRYASRELWSNRDFVTQLMQENGSLLEFVSSELQKDREVVITAVKNYGPAIRYAKAGLKAERKIALVAVLQSSVALRYVAPKLRTDPELLWAAGQADQRAVGKENQWAASKADQGVTKTVTFADEKAFSLCRIPALGGC